MTDSVPIESLLEGLSEPDSAKRESAARSLFERGREAAQPAIEIWLADADLKQLFAFPDHGRFAATVGVAVHPANFDRVRIANGSPRLADVPPDQDAREFELHFGREVRLDILTTGEPEGMGAIARFLGRTGEGIQQVELAVHDVDRATGILRLRFGQAPIYPETREGAGGTRVNFFLVTTPEGKKVLIELVEDIPGRP